MKTLLRTSALIAALAFTALTAGKATEVPGSCYTICRGNSMSTATSTTWSATYRQCCFGFSPPRPVNPCPPGYHYVDGEAVYTSPDGFKSACPA
jgi:hypothetical protein